VCAFGALDSTRGIARAVDGAPGADALVLVDSSSGDSLLLTDPTTWRVDPLAYDFDVSRACGDVVVDAGAGRALPPTPVAGLLYRLLLAADALGGVQRVLGRTVAYALERKAFGRPIGAFQAVQHRLVDHTIRVRGMALTVAAAAGQLTAGAPDAPRQVAVAEVAVTTGAVHVLHDLLQLTGAIGFTWEYGLHLYERRAHHDAHLAANPRAAVGSLARAQGWPDVG
jgi:alkylation response protein AidB-like acyl-CoA dehydrogenase